MSKIGYIYSITPINGGYDGDIYYGSTININDRYDFHIYDYNRNKNITSKILFDKHGVDNCQINIVEEVKYNDKSELLYRERFYIDNNDCINKKSPIKTKEEILNDKKEYKTIYKEKDENIKKIQEYNKNYYIQNKEDIIEYNKQYREKNKEDLKEKKQEYYEYNKEEINNKKKEYRKNNKEEILKKEKEYYENNKERINEKNKRYYNENKAKRQEKNKEMIICEICNKEITKINLKRHQNSKNCVK